MMKILYRRTSSNASDAGNDGNLSSGTTTTTYFSNSSGSLNNSSSNTIHSAGVTEVSHGAVGNVYVQFYNESIDERSVSFSSLETCEDICLSLARRLDITPTMLHCFGLGVLDMPRKKHYWIASKQKPSDVCNNLMQAQENKVFFRIRFLPEQSSRQLDDIDPKCLEYLTWQLKWDFLHSFSSCTGEDSKTDEARGFSCMLILLALRMNTEREQCTENLKNFMKKKDLDNFLPVPLRKKLVEGKVLKNNMLKKVEELQKSHPLENHNAHYIMKWCLQVAMKQTKSYKMETFIAYDLDIDREEFEHIDEDEPPSEIADKQELMISIKVDKFKPRLTVMEINERHTHIIDTNVENITKLEIRKIELDRVTWWRVHVFRQDGHPEMLYFEDSKEAYSFATCVECYSRLTVDFYDTVCTELVPSFFSELNTLRAHGPVRDEFVKKKLLKKNSKDLYILRVNLTHYNQYDVLYLPSRSTNTKLKTYTLPKIKQVEDGYIVEGSTKQPQNLKVLVNDLVKEANLFPSTCLRIKPQSEGCDLLYSLILGKEPVDIYEEVEEMREKKKIENQPKVYNKNDLKLQSMLGQGHFTEVYNGLLFEQHQVVVKKMRVKDIEDSDFRLVQEAFSDGIEKLTALADCQYFLSFMGMSMMPDVCMIMKGTGHGSLQQFLQSRDPSLPMLSLHHLLDANIQIASALVYMEEKNCYHGNLHCGNISVIKYDNRTMLVRICDPGLVSLYNRLPLEHPVNTKRLPWLAPELHSNLSSVTAQSEVFAYGTTLWQMFSMGVSPINHDPKLKNKRPEQIASFFAEGNLLTCPQFLALKNEDPDEVKEVKHLLYNVMISCWNKDIQERTDPKRLLKAINSNTQTYEDTYHKYNVIPEYDVGSSGTYSIDNGLQSSGFNTIEQNVDVPDISCLKPGSKRNVTTPPDRSQNRTQTGNQLNVSTGVLRPIRDPPAPQLPLAQGATNSIAINAPFNRAGLSPGPKQESCNIEKGKLVIDWDVTLGRGHYGAVYKGKLYPKDELRALDPNAGPETVVVKVLRLETADSFGESLRKEASVMQKLHHPNIVKFYDICNRGRYLVMEFVENNSLFLYVHNERQTRSISQQTFLQLSTDIAAGMEYLESQRVIHCDLAARNVLLSQDYRAKISDFGLSKILTKDKDYYRRTTDKTIPILWCAPEWVGYKRYLHKSDVWSYGVTIWEMYSYGKTPFLTKNLNKMIDVITKGERLAKPRYCPDEIYTLLHSCWKLEPTIRPDFKQIKTRLEQLRLESTAQVSTTMAQTIASRPKQVAVRRLTQQNNPVSKPTIAVVLPQNNTVTDQGNAIELNNAVPPVNTVPPVDNTTRTNTQATECIATEADNQNTSNTRVKTLVNGHDNCPPNTTGQPLSGAFTENQEDQPTEGINGTEMVTNDELENQTTKKEVLNCNTVQGTHSANSENQSGLTEKSFVPEQEPSTVNGKNITSTINHTGLSTVSSNQSETVPKQLTGAGHSSGKDNKKSSENILIDKGELLYSTKDELGKGGYGQVFKATYRGETVAVKQCTVEEEYARFKREFELLYNLKKNSANIVKFIGLFSANGSTMRMYVMEYLEGGSLYSYLIGQKQAGNVVDVRRKVLFLIDIAKGMDCLFQKSIVHGDLTAKNVLLTRDLNAKICDLGWAKQLESDVENVEYNRKHPSFQPMWAAPEVFERSVYTKFSDTWSYGVVCIETFQDCAPPSYSLPWNELEKKNDSYLRKLYVAILKGHRIPKPALCLQTLYDNMIMKCWEKEYKDRIRYMEIIDVLLGYEQNNCTENQ